MAPRNRAEGWKHAKKSGHQNEQLAAQLVQSDPEIQQRLLHCAHWEGEKIVNIEFGGLNEHNVPCVFPGESTKSKSDLWLVMASGKRLNVSLKKDASGQAFLIGIDRFIRGYEAQYRTLIPNEVKRALMLYFGSAQDIPEIVKEYASSNIPLQVRKHRLVAETLNSYDPTLAGLLLFWMDSNMENIFDFCFSRGLAQNPEDWAHVLWYRNLLGEFSFDTMINLQETPKMCFSSCFYGNRNGGSTIQLPFGFVQWHSPTKSIPGSMQFHHSYAKILDSLR